MLKYLGFLTFIQAESLSLTICKDNLCSKDCVKWTAYENECNHCVGVCSTSNPSSIVTSNTISLYSDYLCLQSIPDTKNIQIVTDNKCHLLTTSGYPEIILGSYLSESNMFQQYEFVFLSVCFSLLCCSCVFCFKCRKEEPAKEIEQNNYVPPNILLEDPSV
jgi:hypothetical protein